jgi:hypothetical protein
MVAWEHKECRIYDSLFFFFCFLPSMGADPRRIDRCRDGRGSMAPRVHEAPHGSGEHREKVFWFLI